MGYVLVLALMFRFGSCYGTGASVSLKDEDGKYQADVSTNYGLIKEESVSRDVSAKFPDGSV